VEVGHGLGLDALGGVDHQDGALAGGEGAGDLVGEIDVAGGVEQVELVGLAVAGGVFHRHRVGLDGDALLALKVHRVELLVGAFAHGDVLVISSRRSESVVFPWSMWAMMEKLRVSSVDMVHLEWVPGKCELEPFLRELCQFGYVAAPAGAVAGDHERRRLAARLGLCGAFALNTMAFSLPVYLGNAGGFRVRGLVPS
jgi:hypothetical protein